MSASAAAAAEFSATWTLTNLIGSIAFVALAVPTVPARLGIFVRDYPLQYHTLFLLALASLLGARIYYATRYQTLSSAPPLPLFLVNTFLLLALGLYLLGLFMNVPQPRRWAAAPKDGDTARGRFRRKAARGGNDGWDLPDTAEPASSDPSSFV